MADIQAQNDKASTDFPSVEIEGHLVHVCEYDPGDWQVWLNTEAADFDGLCIGFGPTREVAVTQAARALRAVIQHLQGGHRG